MSSFSLSPCDNYVRFCVHRLRLHENFILRLRLHEIFVLRLRFDFLRNPENKKSTLKRALICGRNVRNPYISRDFSCINTEVLRWWSWQEANVCHGFTLHTIHLATQILRLSVPPTVFLLKMIHWIVFITQNLHEVRLVIAIVEMKK
jgi:hypothetical protein